MEIRFIKLGQKGVWESTCIRDNTMRLDYASGLHPEALRRDWGSIHSYWLKERKGKRSVATSDVNQIRDFYELSEDTIWVTFHRRRMFWCQATTDVRLLPDGTVVRDVIGNWSDQDRKGRPLLIENIDGRVTKVRGYQGTICRVALPEYLIRKIDGEAQPEITDARQALLELEQRVEGLIAGLWWPDFELLVDLLFSKSGWQRLSVLGKTEKDIDLDVFSPFEQKRAFVQVKSATNANTILKYYDIFMEHDQFEQMFFVFHTLSGPPVTLPTNGRPLHLWGPSKIAKLVINAGLTEWLIAKRS